MDIDERVFELLLRFEEMNSRGETLYPEELCRDCPELLPEVRRRLAGLRALELPKERAEPASAGAAGTAPVADRYTPDRFHREGGLGQVWLAHDGELQREVALKRVKPAYAHSAESRRRFLREAEITARLQHPGIVPVYGLVHDAAGQPCYAMRFIEGESLRDAVQRFHAAAGPGRDPGERRLGLRQLLARFVAVCNTIAFAHSRAIVHRDLKPQNIMLGKFGETLVVDWGLAKPFERTPEERAAGETTLQPCAALKGEETRHGEALGTPAYMSPEQAAGRWDEVGAASDIYSLGATLYAILTGQPPFQGGAADALLQQVQRGDFVPPRQRQRDVPAGLEAVCLRAMAAQPADRYGSATALAQEIERWLADEPVSTYAEPWRERARRWARRHRTAVVAAAVAALLLLAGGVAGLFVWQEVERREQDTRRERLQQAQESRDKLRRGAESGQLLGLNELGLGRFASAEAVFREALERLDKDADVVAQEPALTQLRADLATRLERTQRLVQFYTQAEAAERSVAEGFESNEQQSDQVGRTACEAALQALEIFAWPAWWEHLADTDLTAAQRGRLRQAVYRQLLFLACLRTKAGVKDFGAAAHAPAYRGALEAVAAAQRFHPTSYGAALLEMVCDLGLGDLTRLVRPLAVRAPDSAVDYYFVGMLQVWIAQEPEHPITRLAGRPAAFVTGLDFETPLATGEHYLRTAVALDSQHYWTHFWRGVTLLYRQPDWAELAFDACIAADPQVLIGYGLRAQALKGQMERATEPRQRTQLVERALKGLNEALRLHPDSARAHVWRGMAHQYAHDDAKALADFAAALRLDPGHTKAYRARAQFYLDRQEPRRAIAELDQALGLEPANHAAYSERGIAHFRNQDFQAAVADYSEAIHLDERRALYYFQRGNAYRLLRDFDKAVADFSAAIRLDRNYWYAYYHRGMTYKGKQDPDRALADFTQALKLGSKDPEVSLERGLTYLDKRNPGAAVADFSAAVRLAPKNIRYRIQRAVAHRLLGAWEQAIEDCTAVLHLEQKHLQAYRHRGAAHVELCQWDQAAADFARAGELAPDSAWPGCLQARLQREKGDRDGCRKTCTALLARFGDTRDAVTANQVVWTCLVLPDAVPDYGPVRRLVGVAAGGQPALALRIEAAILVHTGQCESALQKLREANQADGTDGNVRDWLVQALAQQQLGQRGEAQRWLVKAVAGLEREPMLWESRIDQQRLRGEVEAALKKEGQPARAP
jgi:tetratricopeptide (TPR) repeat protein/tRNA A-37 threonylcarbamoyl transferase component Bud32